MSNNDLLGTNVQNHSFTFIEIFKTYYVRMCFFAQQFKLDKAEAEDVVSEVFIKFLNNNKSFDNNLHLKSYLYRAVKNGTLDYFDKKNRLAIRENGYLYSIDDLEKSYLESITISEAYAELYSAMKQLPIGAAEIVQAFYFDKKSNQEIADERGISVQTVKNQKIRALTLLRSKLCKESFYFLFVNFFI